MSRLGLVAYFLLTSLVVLVNGLVPTVIPRGCGKNWFGSKCEFLCHCAVPGCSANGDCPVGVACSLGYFGPGCQYVSLGYISGSKDNPRYLQDDDPKTCNMNPNATIVKYSLTSEYRFSWLRIAVSETGKDKPFILKLNGEDKRCTNMRTTYSSVNFVDVTCETTLLVTFLVIEGPIVPHICGIYFSGGRNVAIKQRAVQSSTYAVDFNKSQAFHAVDGNTANDHFTSDSCSNTKSEQHGSTWNLTFSRQQILYRIRIYNRVGREERLSGMSLKTYSSSGLLLDTYTANYEVSWLTKDITMLSHVPVKRVVIKGGVVHMVSERILNLCEVETYGETLCPDGRYGLDCGLRCKCSEDEYCDLSTGWCATGCPSGLYGYQCKDTCPLSCLMKSCMPRFGSCDECSPGYSGENCTEKCEEDTYGEDCVEMCSDICIDGHCNHITGSCDKCPGENTGPTCEDCTDAKFGQNCSQPCPDFCSGSVCDIAAGNCYQCNEGRLLPKCLEFPVGKGPLVCIDGKYGVNCEDRCSPHCARKKCDRITGKCFGCQPNRMGFNCEYSSELPWLYLVIAGVIILLFLLLLLLLKERSDVEFVGE